MTRVKTYLGPEKQWHRTLEYTNFTNSAGCSPKLKLDFKQGFLADNVVGEVDGNWYCLALVVRSSEVFRKGDFAIANCWGDGPRFRVFSLSSKGRKANGLYCPANIRGDCGWGFKARRPLIHIFYESCVVGRRFDDPLVEQFLLLQRQALFTGDDSEVRIFEETLLKDSRRLDSK